MHERLVSVCDSGGRGIVQRRLLLLLRAGRCRIPQAQTSKGAA